MVVRGGNSRRRVRGEAVRGVVVRRLCRQGLYRPGRPSDRFDQRLIPPLACPWCMALTAHRSIDAPGHGSARRPARSCAGGMDRDARGPFMRRGAWIAMSLARSCAGGMNPARHVPGMTREARGPFMRGGHEPRAARAGMTRQEWVPFMRGGHGSRRAWPAHARGAWIATSVARSCAGAVDRAARARPDRPIPWANALIDTPQRDALQHRAAPPWEPATQTMAHQPRERQLDAHGREGGLGPGHARPS